MSVEVKPKVKVADEVWLALASLQRQHSHRSDFSIEEIMESARSQNIYGSLRPGVYVHVVQHCVANRPPNPARYRMLFETAPGRRRLFHAGDAYHPDREGGKITPAPEDLPPGFQGLVPWYREWSEHASRNVAQNDPLLALRGSGTHLWANEHADEYIRRLREGWE